ncbi:Excinuclease ABC C subunit domain protein [Methylobacter tundripaludum SV96]|uniref:Excinuclease ABC C subunit domain protein n=2 Tax=Methylobacter tundripaludum TaxID=173365 RepID=G3IYK3_METTV|nr:Excinuclease ABC C subunit domain protein [Methylobacter tundripaludum SV96]
MEKQPRVSCAYNHCTNCINVIPAGNAGNQNTGMCYSEPMEKQPCVYILASRPNGTLYIGVTSNLIGRVYQHRQNLIAGFTQRYNVHNLVWYEPHEQLESAILREKQLKNWSRVAKKRLIELTNPQWHDLSPDLGLPSLAAGSRHSLPG